MKTNKQIRVGILGSGSILEAHVRGLLAAGDRCRVVAVTARRPDAVAHVRKLLGPDVAICGEYEEVIRRSDVDAVDILLPHDLHLPATLAAAKAGQHVFVEKVMACNTDECDQMIAACKAAGVTLSVCHDRRYHPDWIALKKILDAGLLGEIHYWKMEHNQDLILPADLWIRSKKRVGGGAIMSCLTHQLDALRWYAGEAAAVTCMTKVVPERMEGETIGAVLLRMKSGALAQCTINWMTSADCSPCELVHVVGDRGEAYYWLGKGSYAMLRDNTQRLAPFVENGLVREWFSKLTSDRITAHEGCVMAWLKMLRGEPVEFTTTGEDSRHTVALAEAAYYAADHGLTVNLPLKKGLR